jgi:hypothetical protein
LVATARRSFEKSEFPHRSPAVASRSRNLSSGEAKRLRGTSRRPDRSLREIAVDLEKLGFGNERGARFSPSSVASMLTP